MSDDCEHRWETVRSKSRNYEFERCKDCRMVFPCKHECLHFDCAHWKIERGLLIDYPDHVTIQILDAESNIIFDNIPEED